MKRSDERWKGAIGDKKELMGRWRGVMGVMGDEEEWWEMKRSDGRRREVMGDKEERKGVMGDEEEWWETKRNDGRRRGWNNEK